MSGMGLRWAGVLGAGVLLVAETVFGAECRWLYGIHDHDPNPAAYLAHIESGGGCGWVTATVAVGHDPNDRSGADFSFLAERGHTVICRLNHGYFPNGTIPLAAAYDDFARRCANFVTASRGCQLWVIGNELNIAGEWPFDGRRFRYVAPEEYAVCFRKVYQAIKAVRPGDKVLSAPLAPWAGPFGASTLNGYPADGLSINWVQYLNRMLTAIAASGPLDGIALHINSRGYSYADIHSTQQVTANGQQLYFSFYVYKDWIRYGIPAALYGLPLYATECNGYYYWKGGHPEVPAEHYEPGWVQDIYAEVNRHNQSAQTNGLPVFRCVNLYRWCGSCDGWNIDGSPYETQILADLDAAVAGRYQWPALPTRLSLVPSGATWKYLDNGSNQGSAWRSIGFDDRLWASGRAQLGFGDGDEVTTINGGPADNRYVTTYFRRAFLVEEPSFPTHLTVRLLRDDGAAVHVNGVEIFRSNLPAGALGYQTLATSAVSGSDEQTFYSSTASAALLRPGTNVVAVEVHQANATSSDASFDLELAGWGNLAPTVLLASPVPGEVLGAGGSVRMTALADDPEGGLSRVEFYSEGTKIGEDTNPPYDLAWTGTPEGLTALTAVAVDEGGLRATSAPVTIILAPPLIRAGSVWKYRDAGLDLGTGWRGIDYAEAGWLNGPAQLGFGDGDEATVVNGGPSTNRYRTIYFRHRFTLADRDEFTNLVVRLLRDDGGAVYLNGTEVFRNNLPGGALIYSTLALAAASDEDEKTRFYAEAVDAAWLRAGTNVVAVEVHQNSATSSDLSFDLELLGLRKAAPPRLAIALRESGVEVRWPAYHAAYRLESTRHLSGKGLWSEVTTLPAVSNGQNRVVLPAALPAEYFRLRRN